MTAEQDELDRMLAGVRDAPTPELSETLMARILHDAEALQPVPEPAPIPQVGFWASLREAIGGWGPVGGVAMAGVAGLWIGVAPPAVLTTLTDTVAGDSLSVTLYSEAALLSTGD